MSHVRTTESLLAEVNDVVVKELFARLLAKQDPSNRRFVYCENTEGGMATFEFDAHGQKGLRGWMSSDCKADDKRLVKWMETATLGEWTEHRLGACFCVVAESLTP
jgi:hypothetical protein